MRMRILLAIVGIVLAAGAVPASADITPILETVVPIGDGTFLWTYRVEISAAQSMNDDGTIPTSDGNPEDDTNSIRDYLTIYDFAGLQTANPMAVQFSESGFDFRLYAFGATPADALPEEDGDTNVTIFRDTDAGDLAGAAGGPYTFFVALLSNVPFSAASLNSYSGEGTNRQLGTGETNVGEVVGPGTAPPQVPEPGTLLLMGSGLLALGMFRRKSS
jgi:hypothetical protein